MSRGRGRRPKHPGFGQSKHRRARTQRFARKHPSSPNIPCPGCGKHPARCTCKEATHGG